MRLAILDLEWTSWEGAHQRDWRGPGEEQEIIEIGLIMLADSAGLEEVGDLDILVKPRINPELSDYFIELTGISQADVETEGLDFAEALAIIVELIGGRTVYSFGLDGEILAHNCRLNDLAFPLDPAQFVNIIPAVKDYLGEPTPPRFFSGGLPEIMGFPRPGEAHRAVSDCRCIAEALRLMRRDRAF